MRCAYIVMANMVMACMVMAYVVMAYLVMSYMAVPYMGMRIIATAGIGMAAGAHAHVDVRDAMWQCSNRF